MPLHVSAVMLAALNLTADNSLEALSDSLESLPAELQGGIFDSAEAKAAVLKSAELDQALDYEICNPVVFRRDSHHYHQVLMDGNLISEIIEMQEIEENKRPVTSAETALAVLCAKVGCLNPFDESSPFYKRNIVFWRKPDINRAHKEWLFSVFNTTPVTKPTILVYSDFCKQKAELSHSSTCKIMNQSDIVGKLLAIAINETTVRWKYLGYYRIFENGYLHEVYNELSTDFFSCTDKALDTAKEKIKNELNLFVNIVEVNVLVAFFESIFDIINTNKNNTKFFYALKRVASFDERYKKFNGSKFKQGVFFAYQIRCAIVHSGESHLVFEKYEDSELSLLDILPDLEKSVWNYIGLTFN